MIVLMQGFYSVLQSEVEGGQFNVQLSDTKQHLIDHFVQTGQVLQLSSNAFNTFSIQQLTSEISSSSSESYYIPYALSEINQDDQNDFDSQFYDKKSRIKSNKNKSTTSRKSIHDKLQLRQIKLQQYQKLITAMMFELKLVKRLHDDFYVMLDQAQETYTTKSQKQQLKQKEEIIITSDLRQIQKIKNLIAVSLAKHMNILTERRRYKKFSYYKYQVQQIQGSFALDFRHFVYEISNKNFLKTQDMKDYKGFMRGKQSKNFQRYSKKQQNDNLCFSLIFGMRTIDLQANNLFQIESFIKALKELEIYL